MHRRFLPPRIPTLHGIKIRFHDTSWYLKEFKLYVIRKFPLDCAMCEHMWMSIDIIQSLNNIYCNQLISCEIP